ncbi:amino acid ABC transporter permease [uncultured Adlercreutzia sp.]|uniref:amino acid ABC transporter permease n=1 Tax=uncultured Adlercreutzia sp. TaxID=875803 RepID=UPI0025E1A033|nr:amino acid ABC transporter permease [uncultured Adlercreutzia sp.]
MEVFAPYKWEALFERWPELLAAFGTTVAISALALVIALVLGFVFGVFSVSRFRVLRALTRVYVETVQNVPLLLQVFVLYAVFPLIGLSMTTFWIGVLAIGLYHGGYMSEVVRSGIGSVHRGQFEAAKSQGFSPVQTMTLIILPQAMRIILPPLAVQAANLVKNTSVLALVAGGELMYFSNSFAGDTSYYGPAYVMAALLYFVICFPLSRAAVGLEKRMGAHRHVTTGDATEALTTDATEVTPGTHDITGHAASIALAGGVTTMARGTTTLVPARQAASPRHPHHTWAVELAVTEDGVGLVEACALDDKLKGEEHPIDWESFAPPAFTGNQAAEIADDIGLELAQDEVTAAERRRAVARARRHERAERGRSHPHPEGRGLRLSRKLHRKEPRGRRDAKARKQHRKGGGDHE